MNINNLAPNHLAPEEFTAVQEQLGALELSTISGESNETCVSDAFGESLAEMKFKVLQSLSRVFVFTNAIYCSPQDLIRLCPKPDLYGFYRLQYNGFWFILDSHIKVVVNTLSMSSAHRFAFDCLKNSCVSLYPSTITDKLVSHGINQWKPVHVLSVSVQFSSPIATTPADGWEQLIIQRLLFQVVGKKAQKFIIDTEKSVLVISVLMVHCQPNSQGVLNASDSGNSLPSLMIHDYFNQNSTSEALKVCEMNKETKENKENCLETEEKKEDSGIIVQSSLLLIQEWIPLKQSEKLQEIKTHLQTLNELTADGEPETTARKSLKQQHYLRSKDTKDMKETRETKERECKESPNSIQDQSLVDQCRFIDVRLKELHTELQSLQSLRLSSVDNTSQAALTPDFAQGSPIAPTRSKKAIQLEIDDLTYIWLEIRRSLGDKV